MTEKDTATTLTVAQANVSYARQQEPLNYAFTSPFAMLNLTLQDCNRQRAELGISHEELERDKATFNNEINAALATDGYPDTNEKVDYYLQCAFAFIAGKMTEPNVPQNYWPLVACHAALMTVRSEQQKPSCAFDAAITNVALFAQGMINIAWKSQREQVAERIAGEALRYANYFADKRKNHSDQLKAAQEKQARERKLKAAGAHELVTKTLFPEWRTANPDISKATGYRHCAKVLNDCGYKSANGSPVTWETVKSYFRKKRTSTETLS